MRHRVAGVEGLELHGDSLYLVVFGSTEPDLDIYGVLDQMSHHGWSLNGLQQPASIHLCTTLRHTKPGVAERFVEDLQASVDTARGNPAAAGQMAPVYGMASSVDGRGTVEDILRTYVDVLFRVSTRSLQILGRYPTKDLQRTVRRSPASWTVRHDASMPMANAARRRLESYLDAAAAAWAEGATMRAFSSSLNRSSVHVNCWMFCAHSK